MAVTDRDVRHIAALARLALEPARVPAIAAELDGILAHMAALQRVDTKLEEPVVGVGSGGMPLRADAGPAYRLEREREAFAPEMRDGFFLVPRLETHADAGSSAPASAGADAGISDVRPEDA